MGQGDKRDVFLLFWLLKKTEAGELLESSHLRTAWATQLKPLQDPRAVGLDRMD